jgi:hypothetical protein
VKEYLCTLGAKGLHTFDEAPLGITPSTDWAQGGAIIEREGIELLCETLGFRWVAMPQKGPEWSGPTPLIAAMRCYVASKLGFEVELPEEINAEQTAFVKAYADCMGYAPEAYVKEFMQCHDGKDMEESIHYTSVMDALCLWDRAKTYFKGESK